MATASSRATNGGSRNGTMPAFNRLDVNNDNRLTRGEFRGQVFDEGRLTTRQPQRARKSSWIRSERWTNTGLRVRAGDLIVLRHDRHSSTEQRAAATWQRRPVREAAGMRRTRCYRISLQAL